MLSRLTDFIVGREPVVAATGIAAVITALCGALTAFDVLSLSAEQIAAIGALAAAVAGWAGRSAVTPVAGPSERQDRGSIPLALLILIGLGVLMLFGLAFCTDALFDDESERDDVGLVLVRNHEEPRCYDEYDCGEGDSYGDGRGGYSGGPSGGYYEGGKGGSDYDGDGDGNRCRNFCFYGVPYPGQPGQGGEQPREPSIARSAHT